MNKYWWVLSTILAANDGQPPFTMYYYDKLVRFSEVNNDYGIPILVSSLSVTGRALNGQDYQVSEQTVFDALFVLFVLTALLLVLPGIPLLLAGGGVLALAAVLNNTQGFSNGQLWGGPLIGYRVLRDRALWARSALPFAVRITVSVIRDEWFRIIIESPWFLLDSVVSKIPEFLRNLVSLMETRGATVFPLGMAALFVTTLYALRQIRNGVKLWLFFTMCTLLALFVFSASVPLFVHPSYSNLPLGAGMVLFTIFPAATVTWARQPDVFWHHVAHRQYLRMIQYILTIAGVAVLIAAVLVLVFCLFQYSRYQAELRRATQADPLAEIQNLKYQYAHRFNALPRAEQEALIARLQDAQDPRVVPISDLTIENYFVGYFALPVAVMSDNQLHRFVQLRRHPTVGNLFPVLEICAGAECEVIRFQGLAWDDGYRMFSVPITSAWRSEPLAVKLYHNAYPASRFA